MDIKIKKLNKDEIKTRNITDWPIWEKEISEFDWYYDSTEECLLLEGKVTVKTEYGNVEFGKGDFVTFPKGLKCKWYVKEPVKKYYNFSD